MLLVLPVAGRGIAQGTGVVAAFAASLCCLGPVVLVALGLGTAAGAVSAFFDPLRPWLLALAFALVGWRLVALHRRPAPRLMPDEVPARGNKACNDPVTGTCCPVDPAHRKEKALTWGALVLVVLFAALPYALGHALPRTGAIDATAAARGRTVYLAIEGMTCGACARTVEGSIAKVPGVLCSEVDLAKKEACVIVDPDRDPGDAALVEAVSAVGYRASPKGGS